MYALTLNVSEQNAILWVADRYAHGNDLRHLLEFCMDDEDFEWGQREYIFEIPEYRAWEIRDLLEDSREGLRYACFSDTLSAKLNSFCDAII